MQAFSVFREPFICSGAEVEPQGSPAWAWLGQGWAMRDPRVVKSQTLPTGAVLEAAKSPRCAQVFSQLLQVLSDVMLLLQNNCSPTCLSTGSARGTR